MKLFSTSSLLLKHQATLFEHIRQKKIGPVQVAELLFMSVIGLAIFGAVMSIPIPDWWHALNLMWKMIVLIFGSVALCVPALYVFSSIRGSYITLPEVLLLICGSVATMALVVVALAPISWFFTWTTNDVSFIRVMNAAMIGLGLLFGLIFIARGMLSLHAQIKLTHPEHKSAVDILFIWLILVCVVVVQMNTKLGPWYHIEQPNEVCYGSDFCFPQEPKGTMLAAPSVAMSADGVAIVQWSIPKNYCEINEVQYLSGGGMSGWPAECKQGENSYDCQAQIGESKDAPSGKIYRLQAHNTNCTTPDIESHEQNYISPTISFVKP